MDFIAISLKGKKLDEFINEIKEKGIRTVIDVRRHPVTAFNSAKWFYPRELVTELALICTPYVFKPIFSNKNRDTHATQFLTQDMRQKLVDYFFYMRKKWIRFPVGFICYCTEEKQQLNDCHVSWICKFLAYHHALCWKCEYNDESMDECDWGQSRYIDECKYFKKK